VILTGALLNFCGYFGIHSLTTGALPYSYGCLIFFALVAGERVDGREDGKEVGRGDKWTRTVFRR
jgi:hypothetical protein